MRKFVIGGLALALSVGITGSVVAATADQTIDGKITPTKLPKKKFKNATVSVTTLNADADNPNAIPPKAVRAAVDFSKNVRFKTDKVPQCTDSLENTDRTTALGLCGDSKVSKDGGSSATVALPLGPGGARVDVPASVMAFNGPKVGKKPSLILWTRVEALSSTSILKGVIKDAPGKPYGKRLDVTIPLIAGGAGALSEFNAKVNKGNYVQARCASKTMKFRGIFAYTDAKSETALDSHKCKRA